MRIPEARVVAASGVWPFLEGVPVYLLRPQGDPQS